MAFLGTFVDKYRAAKHLRGLTGVFLAEDNQNNALLYCFNSHTVIKCPFCGLFRATLFLFFVLVSDFAI